MTHRASRRRAFTLAELLVVLTILILLMSILLPIISKVRYAAYTADTQNELSQISNACNQYYSAFQAYPGPFSNDWIEAGQASGGTMTNPGYISMETYTPGTPPIYSSASHWFVSASENLVLGLMGGLRIDSSTNNPAFSPTEVGLGPLSLNPNNPGRPWGSFFPNGANYLMWCEWSGSGSAVQSNQYNSQLTPTYFTDQAQHQAQDSPIPVFVDRFPTPGPLPILYLRARTGAPGIVSDGTLQNPSTTATAAYQYDVRDIRAYTWPNSGGITPGSIGLPSTTQHNLQGVNHFWYTAQNRYYTVKEYPTYDTGTPHNNAGPYFANASITPTNTSIDQQVNYTGRPRAVDQFILISAGPDGIYGTPDDITSFGDVSQ
jgi:type II secretory pathway pseudopilin PulG